MAVKAKFFRKMQINMDNNTFEEVKRLADDQGVSNAEILRQALEAGLPKIRNRDVENPSVS